MLPLPKKVLVGDSDDVVLAIICHILNRQGFATEPIADRADIPRVMRDGLYDAIIVDAMLEGVVEALPSAKLHAKRIILTSVDDVAVDGVHATLRKPLEFEVLINTVRNCVVQDA